MKNYKEVTFEQRIEKATYQRDRYKNDPVFKEAQKKRALEWYYKNKPR